MAAGKNQPETVVRNFAAIIIWFFKRLYRNTFRFQLLSQICLAADAVNCFMPSSLNDPCSRKFWYAGGLPLIYCRSKCFLRRLFRQVKVAYQSDQGGDNPSPIGSVNLLYSSCGVHW